MRKYRDFRKRLLQARQALLSQKERILRALARIEEEAVRLARKRV